MFLIIYGLSQEYCILKLFSKEFFFFLHSSKADSRLRSNHPLFIILAPSPRFFFDSFFSLLMTPCHSRMTPILLLGHVSMPRDNPSNSLSLSNSCLSIWPSYLSDFLLSSRIRLCHHQCLQPFHSLSFMNYSKSHLFLPLFFYSHVNLFY